MTTDPDEVKMAGSFRYDLEGLSGKLFASAEEVTKALKGTVAKNLGQIGLFNEKLKPAGWSKRDIGQRLFFEEPDTFKLWAVKTLITKTGTVNFAQSNRLGGGREFGDRGEAIQEIEPTIVVAFHLFPEVRYWFLTRELLIEWAEMSISPMNATLGVSGSNLRVRLEGFEA